MSWSSSAADNALIRGILPQTQPWSSSWVNTAFLSQNHPSIFSQGRTSKQISPLLLSSAWHTSVGGGGDGEQAQENRQLSDEHCSFFIFTTGREISQNKCSICWTFKMQMLQFHHPKTSPPQVQRQDINELSNYESEMSWMCENNVKWQQREWFTCGDASSLSPLIQVRGSAAIACEDVPHVTQRGRRLLACEGGRGGGRKTFMHFCKVITIIA